VAYGTYWMHRSDDLVPRGCWVIWASVYKGPRRSLSPSFLLPWSYVMYSTPNTTLPVIAIAHVTPVLQIARAAWSIPCLFSNCCHYKGNTPLPPASDCAPNYHWLLSTSCCPPNQDKKSSHYIKNANLLRNLYYQAIRPLTNALPCKINGFM